jgi:cytochrome b561
MTSNDLSIKYSLGTRIIHWLTAGLVLILFFMGKYMEELAPADKTNLIQIHASLGVFMFVLTLIRSYFFFKHQRPADLKTASKINDHLLIWIHNAFYFLLIGIALAGIGVILQGGYLEAWIHHAPEQIKSHANIPLLSVHAFLAASTMILLLLHVIGYLKHLILKKENTLKRVF